MVTNAEIASLLRELARLTVLAEGNPDSFRVRAYEAAARAVDGATEPVSEMSPASLMAVRGVGRSTAQKIAEIASSGTIARLEELQQRFPPAFVELTRVPGVGPKTAVLLRENLGVETVEALRSAVKRQALRAMPGLGAKTEQNIARAIERLGIGDKARRTPIIAAMRVASDTAGALRELPGVERVEVMGSLRRFRETIGDIDLLVASTEDSGIVAERFVALPVVADVVAYGARKSAITTRSGMQIDLRVVRSDQWGAASIYFTGSKAHNIRLRQMAIERGWSLNEYALADSATGDVIAAESEHDVYRALGLDWVPPEIREDAGELELAADGDLPTLIDVGDVLGDLHVHTDMSGDGRDSLEAMVAAAAHRGYEYLAITDHAEGLAINGASREQMLAQRRRMEDLQERYPDIALLHGAELNIGRDGGVDYDADFLAGYDFCVASVHSHFDLSVADQTARLLSAIRNPAVTTIGHLTGRQIGRRPGIDLELEAVLRAVEETGTALEINCHLDRLDAPHEVLRAAAGRDVRFVISTDAHEVGELVNIRWGIAHARRAWVSSDQVANTWELNPFLAWVAAVRCG